MPDSSIEELRRDLYNVGHIETFINCLTENDGPTDHIIPAATLLALLKIA